MTLALRILLLTIALGTPLRFADGPGGSNVAEAQNGEALSRLSGATASEVRSVAFTVADLDRSLEFYTAVLGCSVSDQREDSGDSTERLTGVFGARTRSATLTLGEERLELVQYLTPEGRPVPMDSRSDDRWFQHVAIVVSDIDAAYSHLRAHNVRHASTGPQTLPASLPNAAGISAFYFKDPDGHPLEIIHFPAGKGSPRWQTLGAKSALFLGIDHTAIVVADTETSLRLYRDVLGMRLAGESENFGTEQEHLNNVFGARLRITSLRAASGPGIELLEYLSPRDGRLLPIDSRMNDLWTVRTELIVPHAEQAERALRAAGVAHVSPSVVSFKDSAGVCVRDPDGHALVLRQRIEH